MLKIKNYYKIIGKSFIKKDGWRVAMFVETPEWYEIKLRCKTDIWPDINLRLSRFHTISTYSGEKVYWFQRDGNPTTTCVSISYTQSMDNLLDTLAKFI